MNIFLYVTLCATILTASSALNIPVSFAAGTAFVESDDLLEEALSAALRPYGVLDVDVDDRSRSNNVYIVEVYSRTNLGSQFKNTLEDVLKSNFGFSGVVVETVPRARYSFRSSFNGKTIYLVSFDTSSMVKEMQTLANSIKDSVYLDLDD